MLTKREPAASPLRGVELSVLVAMMLLVGTAGTSRRLNAHPPPLAPEPGSLLAVRYTLDTPGGGEIFPALASSSPSQYWPVATLTMVDRKSTRLNSSHRC